MLAPRGALSLDSKRESHGPAFDVRGRPKPKSYSLWILEVKNIMFHEFIEQIEIYATCEDCGKMSFEVFCEKSCPRCKGGVRIIDERTVMIRIPKR